MISKVLSLLLTVLVVTSLFVPAVAANHDIDDGISNPTITPEEALKFRIEHGYLYNKYTSSHGVGYRYMGANIWNIYTDNENFFTINADNDEKRMMLLDFMQRVDDAQECYEVIGPLVGMLLFDAGFLFLLVVPGLRTVIVPAMIGVTVVSTVVMTLCMGSDSECLALAARLRSLK